MKNNELNQWQYPKVNVSVPMPVVQSPVNVVTVPGVTAPGYVDYTGIPGVGQVVYPQPENEKVEDLLKQQIALTNVLIEEIRNLRKDLQGEKS